MAKQKSVAGGVEDPILPFSTLELDGKTYKLCFNLNAYAKAEAASGCNLLSALTSLADLSVGQLRGVLFAALSVAHPKMTIDDAGDLIQPFSTPARQETISAITRALAEAFGLSRPDKSEDPPEADHQPAGAD